jgi:hypothetical protein
VAFDAEAMGEQGTPAALPSSAHRAPLLHHLAQLPRSPLLPATSPPPASLPPPDVPPPANPAGLALLEVAELHESEGDHRKTLDLALDALAPLNESHGGRSLPIARALCLAGATASRFGQASEGLEGAACW